MKSKQRFLPVAEPDLGPLEEEYLLDAFRSGWISSLGSYVDRFEREFADFCEVDHAVAVSNGTAALHLALLAAGVGPGDEVIVPALTFVATAAAVRYAGAEPVFVDSEPDIGTLDPVCAVRAMSPRTKAVVVVHLYGHPADMDPIMEIARDKKLVVIEDAAQAHGARYKGRRVGGIGDIATFSFYANKILTTGEGGAVVTNDDTMAQQVRYLKDHAMSRQRRYWHPDLGFNYRLTNLQAAIGCAQIERVEDLRLRRARVFELYRAAIGDDPELTMMPRRSWAEPTPWLVPVVLSNTTKAARDAVMSSLRSSGIDSRPFFELLPDMPPYTSCAQVSAIGNGCPAARRLADRGINLPSVTTLSQNEVGWVIAALREAVLLQKNAVVPH